MKLKEVWICKPTDMSRGRNIFLIDHFSQLGSSAFQQSCIVQRYITNPFLINGYKWDLRIYVLVTSISPLTIYIYQEGIVRFSSRKFSLKCKDISDVFVHLTNSSINKNNMNRDSEIKWTLRQLKEYFHQRDISYSDIFKQIEKIVTLTLISMIQEVPGG